jgi:hypothetical protein
MKSKRDARSLATLVSTPRARVRGFLFLLASLAVTPFASAQTSLLNYGGTGGAADSTPNSAGNGDYEAIYQQESSALPALTTTVPSGTLGTGTDAYYAPTTNDSPKNGGETTLGNYYYGNGSDTGADRASDALIYDTNGTTGSIANNPLGLGTGTATPNTFNLGTSQTLTYSADFAENVHGSIFISLINPNAPDAGSSSVQATTTGGYLGVGLTYLSYDTRGEPLALQGQTTFAGSTSSTLGGGFANASETATETPTSATEVVRLQLTLINNGNNTDTVSGSLYQLTAIGGTGTLVGTLASETLTLGSAAGQYDLNNSGLALEVGEENIYNNAGYYNIGDVTLTEAVPEPSSLALLATTFLLAAFFWRRGVSRFCS